MAQKLANLKGIVRITGHRRQTLIDAYEKSAPISRRMINKRTGRPFTVYGPLEIIDGLHNDFIAQFSFIREGIKGNFPNDVQEFIQKQANKGNNNRRVNVEILRCSREEI